MTPPEWALVASARLSERFSVEITIGPGGSTVEWTPERPDLLNVTLTKKELRRYRTARNKLFAQAAARLGGKALIVEV